VEVANACTEISKSRHGSSLLKRHLPQAGNSLSCVPKRWGAPVRRAEQCVGKPVQPLAISDLPIPFGHSWNHVLLLLRRVTFGNAGGTVGRGIRLPAGAGKLHEKDSQNGSQNTVKLGTSRVGGSC
jgi:hypothetical protein